MYGLMVGYAEALTCVATTKFRNLWDFSGAERDYRRAIASNPNDATAHQWYALYYERKYDDAIAFARKTEELDPKLSLLNCRIKSLFAKGDYNAGIAEIEKLGLPPRGVSRMTELYRFGGPRTIPCALIRVTAISFAASDCRKFRSLDRDHGKLGVP